MDIYKIYYLSSSGSPENFRYVGLTKNSLKRRYSGHLLKTKYNDTHKDRWIKREHKLGFTILIKLIEDGLTENNVEERERFHIKLLREKGFDLTNLTDGGETNKIVSEVVKEKARLSNLRQIQKRKESGLEHWNKGIKRSAQTIEKLREVHKGVKLSEEHKLKLRGRTSPKKGKPMPEAHRLKLQGKKRSPEVKEKLSLLKKGIKLSEEQKLKRRVALGDKLKGANHPMFGKKPSQITIQKLRITHPSFPVVQYSSDGKFIKEWNGSREAAESLGLSRRNINSCCRGNTNMKKIGGFLWRWKKSVIQNNGSVLQKITEHKIGKSVLQFTLSGVFKAEYQSAAEAFKYLGISKVLIGRCCNGKGLTAGGFKWRFKSFNETYANF